METCDLVVIGAGPGGYSAALRASQLGLTTAVVEKDPFVGGVCLNVGCIPSKALLESSELYAKIAGGLSSHGIGIASPTLDIPSMMTRKAAIVEKLVDGVALLLKRSGVKVLHGVGRLAEPGVVSVEGNDTSEEIRASNILLAMGSRPVELPFLPFDGERVITSTEALGLEKVPERLAVIGAGAIGLELGSVWARLGAEVTVVEMLPRAAPLADPQLSKFLERSLKKQGLRFHLSSRLGEAEFGGDGLSLKVEGSSGDVSVLECEKVLVAVGRRPATDSAGMKVVGIALDETGRVKVDENYETSLPGVYAIGDLIQGPMLAHKASREAEVFTERLVGSESRVNYDAIPSVIYTDPELAQVGLTEEEAREKGITVRTGKAYFKGNGRSLSMGSEEGLAKVIAEEDSGRIVGIHILGPHASELISEGVVAMEASLTAGQLAEVCHPHPTLSEVLMEAARAASPLF